MAQWEKVFDALNGADHASAALGLRKHLECFDNPEVAEDRIRELMEVLVGFQQRVLNEDNSW